jgi:hypothetical protein
VKVTGYKNPALAALWIAEHSSVPFDAESFRHVASIIGDASPEVLKDTAFTITETPIVEGLQRLCNIGGFEIHSLDGVLTCVKP